MTTEQAKKLKPHYDWLLCMGGKYQFAGLHKNGTHLLIYDEPPYMKTDLILISDCELAPLPTADEYALLGKAIKSCGIFGIEIHITGANRSTIQGTRQDGYSKQLDYINKNYNTGKIFTENQN